MKFSEILVSNLASQIASSLSWGYDLSETTFRNERGLAAEIYESLIDYEVDEADVEEGILLDPDRAKNINNAINELLYGSEDLSRHAVKEIEDFQNDVENLLFDLERKHGTT